MTRVRFKKRVRWMRTIGRRDLRRLNTLADAAVLFGFKGWALARGRFGVAGGIEGQIQRLFEQLISGEGERDAEPIDRDRVTYCDDDRCGAPTHIDGQPIPEPHSDECRATMPGRSGGLGPPVSEGLRQLIRDLDRGWQEMAEARAAEECEECGGPTPCDKPGGVWMCGSAGRPDDELEGEGGTAVRANVDLLLAQRRHAYDHLESSVRIMLEGLNNAADSGRVVLERSSINWGADFGFIPMAPPAEPKPGDFPAFALSMEHAVDQVRGIVWALAQRLEYAEHTMQRDEDAGASE